MNRRNGQVATLLQTAFGDTVVKKRLIGRDTPGTTIADLASDVIAASENERMSAKST